MLSVIILSIGSFLLGSIFPNQFENDLLPVKIIVTGIKDTKGEVRIGVYDQKEGFLEMETTFSNSVVKVNDQMVQVVLNLPKGKQYAIAVFHDKNLNQEFDVNFFGIPKEKYGFSNNPNIWFRAPSFEECSFDINEIQEVEIEI